MNRSSENAQELPSCATTLQPLPIRPATQQCGSLGPRRLDSRSLLGKDREVEIEHAGQVYRLRLTSLGKLILTK